MTLHLVRYIHTTGVVTTLIETFRVTLLVGIVTRSKYGVLNFCCGGGDESREEGRGRVCIRNRIGID